jgi:hypothetical protein
MGTNHKVGTTWTLQNENNAEQKERALILKQTHFSANDDMQ